MDHEYSDPGEFYAEIRKAYREVVAECEDEGVDLKNATDAVADLVEPRIKDGSLTVPLDDLIRSAVKDVDRSDGSRADTALRAVARGEESIGLDNDPALDMVVTLGKGRRKSLRFVRQADLMLMDELRYSNLRNAQEAYDTWRQTYEPWFQVLGRQATVEFAMRSGDLPDFDE